MKALLTGWVCLAAFLTAGAKPKIGSETLIFTNVNVVNTRDGRIEQGVTVVISKDRITGVGKVGFVPERRGLQIVNANGKYLVPGMWDMHVHSAFVSPAWDERAIYPLYIANGVTGVRDMGGDPDVLDRRKSQVEHGELLGPHLFVAGPFLAEGKSDQQTIAVNTPEEARKMRGALLQVAQDVPKQEGDPWYECDLIGMTVVDEGGHQLGCLEAILETQAHSVFVVRQAGREALIPAVKEFIRSVDVAQGRMTVRTIEGLVEA